MSQHRCSQCGLLSNEYPCPECFISFNIDEIRSLSRLLEHEYIPNEDEEIRNAVDKVFRIVKNHER